MSNLRTEVFFSPDRRESIPSTPYERDAVSAQFERVRNRMYQRHPVSLNTPLQQRVSCMMSLLITQAPEFMLMGSYKLRPTQPIWNAIFHHIAKRDPEALRRHHQYQEAYTCLTRPSPTI
jgi:hypothetical protein